LADRDPFEGWAILELMGHRRIAGYIREAELAGGSFLRIDVLGADGTLGASQFYAPGAVYCITPTNEETVRELGMRWEPPVVTAAVYQEQRQRRHWSRGCRHFFTRATATTSPHGMGRQATPGRQRWAKPAWQRRSQATRYMVKV
jgi:hypothetical protein